MGQETPPADVTRRERAAQLVAEDRLPDSEIAAAIPIGRGTLGRWKLEPDFQAMVKAHKTELRAGVVRRGIASKQERLDDLTEIRRRLWQIAEERAVHEREYVARNPTATPLPGADTGLVIRRWKVAGGIKVEEYEPDTALTGEIRATLKQAAQELNDWTEKRELTGKDGGPLSVAVRPDLKDLSDEELVVVRTILVRAATPALEPPGGGSGV